MDLKIWLITDQLIILAGIPESACFEVCIMDLWLAFSWWVFWCFVQFLFFILKESDFISFFDCNFPLKDDFQCILCNL